jgi:RNA 2',3'-cyclic 3'-phosphodiesterase
MSETTRSFLALALPREARAHAETLLAELRGRLGTGAVKWVVPENLHVTLRFLGDLDPQRLARARETTRLLDGAFAPTASGWKEIGAFPSPRRAQVLWLGLADGEERLHRLALEVNERLADAGLGRPDKPFVAHVTLGRVRRDRRVDWIAASDRLTIPAAAFSIQTIVLFKSRLTPAGPEYTPLETATACDNRSSGDAPGEEGEGT